MFGVTTKAVRPSGCAASTILACMLALMLVFPFPARSQTVEREQVGVVEMLEGAAQVLHEEDGAEKLRDLAEGDAVFVQDTVRTSAEGKVKLRFLDDSVMDVGADSEVRITSMIYDPAEAGKSNQVLSMLKGLFRFVSGAITEQNPDNTTLQAPLATVGIRGTITDHYLDVSEETVDGTPVRVINSELHALRESAHPDDVVVSYMDSEVVLSEPDSVAEVEIDMPVSVRSLSSFEKRHFGEVAIEPYPFDPEVHKSLKSGYAEPEF